MSNSRIILVTLLLLAILLRFLVMFGSFQFRENTDVLRYKDWGRISYLHGLGSSYITDHLTFGTLPNNQPPGSTYVISAMYFLHLQAAKMYIKFAGMGEKQNAFIVGPLLNTFLRLPQLIADVLIGLIIYLIVREHRNSRSALLGASLILFNPVTIYNSAFWGQMDSLNNLFFMLSLFLLLKKKYILSLLAFGLSLYTKLSIVFLFPYFLLFIFILAKKKRKQIVIGGTITLIILTLSTLPISSHPINWFIQFVQNNSLGEMTNITAFAFNFWWMVFFPSIHIMGKENSFNFSEVRLAGSPDGSLIFAGLPLFVWAILLFIIFTLPLVYSMQKGHMKNKPYKIFLFFSLIALLGFLFLPRMHERYMYPLFPLLATYVSLTNKNYIVLIALTCLHFINMYLVWHPVSLFIFPSQVISTPLFQWIISLFVVIVSLYFYISSIKYDFAKNKK